MSSKKLFIHIPKNAGLTVRRFLPNRIILSSKNNLITKDYQKRLTHVMNNAGEHSGYEHARWRDINKKLTDNYETFAIVRNPWTKIVSRYMYGLRSIERGRTKKGYVPDTFEEFLEERFKYQNKEFYWHRAVRGWYPQKDHVTDEKGNIKCDILRFEHFEEDLKKYFELPESQVIKSSNSFHRGNKDPNWAKWDIDYRTLYNDHTIQIVADWCKDDIEMFNFDFGGTAMKNIWNKL